MGDEVSERQWSDALGVLKVAGDRLDLTYLRGVAALLGVQELLDRILAAADLKATGGRCDELEPRSVSLLKYFVRGISHRRSLDHLGSFAYPPATAEYEPKERLDFLSLRARNLPEGGLEITVELASGGG
ncbi:MAG: hypothetical protein H0X67_20575 [Acidobacteria bacterium]|nr:hypothetical protein [Acidobacteriota bacterium]